MTLKAIVLILHSLFQEFHINLTSGPWPDYMSHTKCICPIYKSIVSYKACCVTVQGHYLQRVHHRELTTAFHGLTHINVVTLFPGFCYRYWQEA